MVLKDNSNNILKDSCNKCMHSNSNLKVRSNSNKVMTLLLISNLKYINYQLEILLKVGLLIIWNKINKVNSKHLHNKLNNNKVYH